MGRPWWVLAFLLPLCCGSTFLAVVFGAGAGGLLGGLALGAAGLGPWGALVSGAVAGASAAVPLLLVAARRDKAACALPLAPGLTR